MKSPFACRLLAIVAATVAVGGCGGAAPDASEAAVAAIPAPAPATPAAAPAAPPPAASKAPTARPKTPEDAPDDDAVEPMKPETEYVSPFPDRVDLFVAPKKQASSVVTEGQDAIELLGFVRVDRPRVILSINGEVTPLAAGDHLRGIEVISISPPRVVLQRGRQRWQASLEE